MQDAYITTPEWGERLKISQLADLSDLQDNTRVASALLKSMANGHIKIRPHSYDKGIKNPELEIDGLIADNKRIQSEKGVSSAFNSAIKQGCQAVVLDLDAQLKRLKIKELSRAIYWRYQDFRDNVIQECYVIYNDGVARIQGLNTIEQIKEALKKLKP